MAGSAAAGRRERVRPDATGGARDCSLLRGQDPLRLVSECVDPFAMYRGHFRGSADLEADEELAAASSAAGDLDDADDDALGRAPASAADEYDVRRASGAGASVGLATAAATCAEGCPACGRASRRLLLSKAVADWLLDVCGPGGGVAAGDFGPYRDADSGKVWASPALSDALQSGTAVLLLLRALLARQGEALPFPPDVVRPGDAPPLRLQNWRLLAPLLEALGVAVADDARTLIIAGEREPLATLLAEMKSRCGEAADAEAAAGAAAAAAAGAAAAKRLAEERTGERKELLSDTVSQAIGLYSIVMACLLALFVEQQCAPNARNPEVHQCSLADDFSSVFEQAVLGVNFACLLVFVVANAVFWWREKFIIEHFQEDPDQPEDALPEEIAAYPAFLERLRAHNKRTYYSAELMFVALLINFVVSAVLILGKHYAGRTSVVGLLSNLFLCLSTTFGYRSTAKACCDSDAATSLFESDPKNPNAIADDKKFLPGVYDPEGAAGGAKAPAAAAPQPAAPQPAAVEPPSPAASARSGSRRGRPPPPPPPPREMERRGGR